MKKRKLAKYFAKLEGIGTETYYKVSSNRSKKEYPVAISFRCSCPYHSLYPYDLKPCRVVKSAMRKMLK